VHFGKTYGVFVMAILSIRIRLHVVLCLHIEKVARMAKQNLTCLLNRNLDFPVADEPWTSLLSEAGMTAEATTDLPKMVQLIEEGSAHMAYVPGAGFCLMMRKGNPYYRGLVIATSKFSGQPAQGTLLVVRQDDHAYNLDDLEPMPAHSPALGSWFACEPIGEADRPRGGLTGSRRRLGRILRLGEAGVDRRE
jgi:hypothetical protein